MTNIYLAGPLFNEMELKRNKEMSILLKEWGFEVYLPQEDGGLAAEMIKKLDKFEVYTGIFKKDVEAIKNCDILLFLLDGRVPDEGACVELGMAYAWNKKCVGYKTDSRAIDSTGDDNLFVEAALDFQIARNLEELKKIL